MAQGDQIGTAITQLITIATIVLITTVGLMTYYLGLWAALATFIFYFALYQGLNVVDTINYRWNRIYLGLFTLVFFGLAITIYVFNKQPYTYLLFILSSLVLLLSLLFNSLFPKNQSVDSSSVTKNV